MTEKLIYSARFNKEEEEIEIKIDNNYILLAELQENPNYEMYLDYFIILMNFLADLCRERNYLAILPLSEVNKYFYQL